MRTTARRSLLAMAGMTTGLAGILAATPAQAAPAPQQAAPEQQPDAALALPVCASWTDYVTGPGTPYDVHIPTTTRNSGNRNCVLTNGAQTDGVFKLQDALNRCYGQGLVADGDFGPATEAAVRNVQRFHGLPVDGDFGPQTSAAMTWPKYLNGSYNHCW
jgi:peptidoglycan hydrolase-like protein with peptidoglycan-binding domain